MDVVEVVLSWEATVLRVQHVRAGCGLTLGERGVLLLPAEILGEECVEVVTYDGETAHIVVPAGARLRVDGHERREDALDLGKGHAAEIAMGPFSVKLSLVPEERCRPAPPLEGLRRSGAGFIAGSALFHAAAFAVVALFAPSLGATEEDPYDADRMALLQRLLDASAQREAEDPPEAAPSPAEGGELNGGQPATGAEGAAGRPDTNKSGRWAAQGTARPEDVTLARENALHDAENMAVISMLSSMSSSDPNAPVVPWGSVLNGADAVSKIGTLFGGTIDDGRGSGGLGLHGLEEGGGGTAHGIGLNGVDALAHAGGTCAQRPVRRASVTGSAGVPGGHVSHFKPPREGPITVANGRLAPEVIRRVVRLNSGRYRACYEGGSADGPEPRGSRHGEVRHRSHRGRRARGRRRERHPGRRRAPLRGLELPLAVVSAARQRHRDRRLSDRLQPGVIRGPARRRTSSGTSRSFRRWRGARCSTVRGRCWAELRSSAPSSPRRRRARTSPQVAGWR